jgi:4-hydroxybenzoate polyprenyltransferase
MQNPVLKPSRDEKLRPLCVDLDGTVILTDMFWESVVILLKLNLLYLFALPYWFLFGIASLKSEIAKRIVLKPNLLPYNERFLSYLNLEKKAGRRLILVTATNSLIANKISNFLGIFDEVIASDNKINISGKQKRDILISRFGVSGFDYAGNSRKDLKIWQAADNSIIVNAHPIILHRSKQSSNVVQVFARDHSSVLELLQSMRIHQWLKNLLLFVPIVTKHQTVDGALILNALTAFFAFSFSASAVYLINDILDIESDRSHPSKKFRPIALGTLGLNTAFASAITFFLLALLISVNLPTSFTILLGGYVLITSLYTVYLKRVALLDVITLASLYALRILAGGAATEIILSDWLIAFSMFFFLSLAFLKRFTELNGMLQNGAAINGEHKINGRGYLSGDANQIANLGVTSGYIAVLVLALWASSEETAMLYANPIRLWFVCPLVLYWISRLWLLGNRGEIDEDPVLYSAKDLTTYLVGLFAGLILFFAS